MDHGSKNDTPLVIRDFIAIACSSFIYQASFVFLLWYIMHCLPAAQVGLFGLALSATMCITTVISWGLRQVYALEYYHGDAQHRRELATDLITIFLMLSMLWGPLAVALLLCLSPWYSLVTLLAAATFFTEFLYQTFVYQGRAAHMALVKSLSALGTVLSALLLLHQSACVECILIAQLLGMCGVLVYGVLLYYYQVGFSAINVTRSYGRMRQYLVQGSPFVPGVLAAWLMASGNRWVLSLHGNLETVALYTIADYITPLFNLVILTPLAGSYHPRMLQKMVHNPRDIFIHEHTNKSIMAGACCALIVTMHLVFYFGRPVALYLLPSAYTQALDGMYYIAWGNIFLFATYFLTIPLFYYKKGSLLMLSILSAAVCNISLAYILVPLYGINGCYAACIIAHAVYGVVLLVMNLFVVRQAHRVENPSSVGYVPAPYHTQ